MDQTGLLFRCLVEKFQGISAAKVMEGVFIVPQTPQLFPDMRNSTEFSMVMRIWRGIISGL
jgi:hypothetical protein